MLSTDTLNKYFFLGLLVLTTFLFGWLLLPFITVLLLATVLAVLSFPLYNDLKRSVRYEGLASLLTVLLVLLLIVAPTVLFGVLVVEEAQDFFTSSSFDADGLQAVITPIESTIQTVFPSFSIDTSSLSSDYTWLTSNVTSLFSGMLHLIVSLFLALITFYYLLKDGIRFKGAVVANAPFSHRTTEKILSSLTVTIKSVIKGNLLIAFLQGAAVALGFFIFGIPNPILWGGVGAVTALVPTIGTTLVLGGGVAYLYFTSGLWVALGLLVWGVIIVGLLDDFLRPFLIGRYIKIHPLLVLVSVIGGIALFGVAGFILGPIILSLFVSVFSLYPEVVKE